MKNAIIKSGLSDSQIAKQAGVSQITVWSARRGLYKKITRRQFALLEAWSKHYKKKSFWDWLLCR